MKRQTCGISFFLLFVLLLGSTYGQISWATPLTDFPDVSTSSTDFSAGIADSNFFLNGAGIAQSLNGDTIPCGNTQVTLVITKNVEDPGGRLSDSRALRFDITVQQSGVPNGVVPLLASENDPGQQSTCIEANRPASVFEISGSTGIFTFTANRCDVPALLPGARGNCVLTNTITGTSADDSEVGVGQSDPSSPPALSTATRGTAQALAEGPTQSGIGGAKRVTNPPFDICEVNTAERGDRNTTLRVPSSATYVVSGKIPLDKVEDALNSLDSGTATIQILSDINAKDMISLSVSSPQFMGKILIEDKDGLKQKIINYNILELRTECKYITLAKAAGPATNANVAPLGELADSESIRLQPSDIDKILTGGKEVRAGVLNAPGQTELVLNPPFATCPADDSSNEDNVALYNIRGKIDRNDFKIVSGNNLIVELTVDLVQSETDLARILNENNPIMKVNLLSQEDKISYNRIGFTLEDVWTDCKQIGLTTKPIFQPIIGETKY